MTGGYVGSILNAGNISASGPALASFTGPVTMLNASQLVTLPSNYLYVGKMLRVSADMAIGNVVTAVPTFTFQVKIGSVLAWTSGAIQVSQIAHAALPATLAVVLKVTAVGAGSAAFVTGVGRLSGIQWNITGGASDGSNGSGITVPATTPANGTGFDSTIANIIDFQITCSASNASNTAQMFNYNIEDLN